MLKSIARVLRKHNKTVLGGAFLHACKVITFERQE
uniref:Uncharacterized protein n=1 Tax=Anguilla anguilla TaxID=7936 RepID=A0A0E9UVS5_ANGAN